MSNYKFKISIIIVGRNDNYGGDFLSRIQTSVEVLSALSSKYNLSAELIIVEWNPPSDRPLFVDAIQWENIVGSLATRIILVPNKIHNLIPFSDKIKLYEYIAKNIGIRRSEGEYCLISNPDILFSEELIETLSKLNLSQKAFYRVDRYDFNKKDLLQSSIQAINIAKQFIYMVNVRQVDYVTPIQHKFTPSELYEGICNNNWFGSHVGMLPPDDFHQVELDDGIGPYGGLHTNASGDFLLASRDNWHRIRGFAEFVDTYTHLDGYACHQLSALGLKQILLAAPCMILHQDHNRVGVEARPRHSNNDWQFDLENLREGKLDPAINDDNWGLNDVGLTEFILEGGRWQMEYKMPINDGIKFHTRADLISA